MDENVTNDARDLEEARNVLPKGYALDEYVIDGCIGAGGFGITYRGRDVNLDKVVAIKEYFPFDLAFRTEQSTVSPRTQIQSDLDDYEWGLKRVIDEARALGRCEHPNVIRVIRYIERNGTAYIVMEFAPGGELAEIIEEKGSLPEEEVRSYLMPLLDGLEAVHASDILHRDLKPSNIIIRKNGTPVLIDFGAARQAIGSRSKSLSAIVTAGFAPNEQYSTKGVQGPWTDIYALGAVAYSCLMGRPPEDATVRIEIDETPPLSEALKGQASPEFLQAIDWAISPSRLDRPQSIAEWRSALLGTQKRAGADVKKSTSKPTLRADTIIATGVATPDPASSRPRSHQPEQPKGVFESPFVKYGLVSIGIIAIIAIGFLTLQMDRLSSNSSTEVVMADPEPAASEQEPEQTQEPFEFGGSAGGEQPNDPSRAPAQQTPDADSEFFNKAQTIGTREAFQIYLQVYPNGKHANAARQMSR
ncbi:MAG: serine/threonine-protein kinase [Pseudomonadota bacterium]